MKKLCRMLALFSPLLLIAAGGCSPKEATQTVVEVWPDASVKDLIQTVTVQAYGLPQGREERSDTQTPVLWPVRYTFTPSSKSASHRIRMVLAAFDAGDKPIANFTLEADIVDEASHYVLVRLGDLCRPEHCESGVCYARVDGADLDKSHQEAVCNGSAPPDSSSMSGAMTVTGAGSANGSAGQPGTGPGSMSTSTGSAANSGTGTMSSGQVGTDAGMVVAVPPASGDGECRDNPNSPKCVLRNDCAKDNGGCQGRCETVIGSGEATCTCQGNSWLKGDGKACADVQPEELLSVGSGSTQRTRPVVAFDSAGNGVVAWTEVSDSGAHSIWTARYSADTKTWGKPSGPSVPGTTEAADLHLALDANGSGLLVWTATLSSHRGLWAARYQNKGFSVADLRRVDAATDTDVFLPAFALDGTGDGLIAWTQNAFPASSLYVARYLASSNEFKSMPAVLGVTSQSVVMNTSVAVQSAGSGLVAWTDLPVSTPPDGGVEVGKSTAFNAVVGAGLGKRDGFDDGLVASTSPDVAMDAQGRGVAVWLRAHPDSTTSYTLLSGESKSGADFGSAPPQVLEDDVSFAAAPHIALGTDSSAFAVWRTLSGSGASAKSLTRGALSVGNGFEVARDLGLMSDVVTWGDIDTTNWTPQTTIKQIDQFQPHWDLAVGPHQTGFVVGAAFDSGSSPPRRTLWLQRVASSTEPARPIRVTDADSVPARCSAPKIAMNANGDGAIVWDRQIDGHFHVYVSLLR